MIDNGYRLYDGLDGTLHFDQIVGGRVYPLKPEASDAKLKRGFYGPDFAYVGDGESAAAPDDADVDYPATEDIDWGDEWVESDHPRVKGGPEAGEFTAGSGGSAGTSKSPASDLLKEGKTLSTQEARELGDKIAARLGIAAEVAEARKKVDALNGKQTIDSVEQGGHKKDGKFTPERTKLHRKILSELFTREAIARAKPQQGQKPVVTVLGGRGGSGKSWLTGEHGPADVSNAIVVDADHFKAQLKPEYQGWNAGQVHEESDHLVNLAEKRAMKYGLNIVHDATLKSSKGINDRVARYEKAGFDVHGHYMHLPPEMATERALKRFASGQKKTGQGRFVAPEIVLGNTDNERNFDKLIPRFKQWSVFDNRGDAPKFVAGSKDYGKTTKGTGDRKAPHRRR
jgi:predicted ABC-type ATPase